MYINIVNAIDDHEPLLNGEVLAFSGEKERSRIIVKYESKIYLCTVHMRTLDCVETRRY